MLCPYCLRNTAKADKCKKKGCEQTIPPLYQQHYSTWRQPAILSVVGFSGHGKTVYLASLLKMLSQVLPQKEVWPGFFRQGLDQDSINIVKNNLGRLEQGELPQPTRRNFPKPSIHLLADMPHVKDRVLLIYDPPGEAFEHAPDIERYAHFVRNATVVQFIVSLAELEEPKGANLERLLQNYTLAMEGKWRGNMKKQEIIVVFTKADLLLTDPKFQKYDLLVEYIQESDRAALRNPRKYMKKMKVVSDTLRQYVRDELRADAFLNMTERYFKGKKGKKATFCLTTALGRPPNADNTLSVKMQPQRAVDPLLWMLDKL